MVRSIIVEEKYSVAGSSSVIQRAGRRIYVKSRLVQTSKKSASVVVANLKFKFRYFCRTGANVGGRFEISPVGEVRLWLVTLPDAGDP